MAAPKRVLEEMTTLDHGPAMALLARTIRTLRPDEVDSYLHELALLGDDGTHAALFGSTIVNHSTIVVAALAHPSAFVQAHAARALEFVSIDDATLRAIVTSVSAESREHCFGIVRRQHRTAFAEQFVSSDEMGDRDRVRLLPACKAEVVEARLESLSHAVTSWKNLARAHPDVVLRYFRASLAATPASLQIEALRRWASAYEALVELRPADLLSLVSSVTNAPGSLLGPFLPRLLRREPGPSGEFLLTRPDLSGLLQSRRLCVALRELDDQQHANQPESDERRERLVVRIVRRCSSDLSGLSQLLRAFAPSKREELLNEALRDVDRANVLLPEPVLEMLPHAVRIAEAARMRMLPASQANPVVLERLSAFAQFDEAFAVLVPITQRSDADERMRAYPLLVDAARRARSAEAMERTLTHLQRLRNEQDPVRSAAMYALRNVPASAFTELHAPLIEQLARFVAEARDTSWSTRGAMQQVLTAVLIEHSVNVDGALFQMSLRGLSLLSGQSSSFSLPRLAERLSVESAAKLIDALLPFAQRRAAEDADHHVLTIAESVGRKGWAHAALTKAVADIAKHGKKDYTVQRAVTCALADPSTRVSRAQALVDFDSSYVMLGPVLAVADRQCQRLLDPMLDGRRIRGRFASSRELVTIPLGVRWFRRWVGRRTAAYGNRLRRVLQTNALTVNERLYATRVAALLPGVGHEIVSAEVSADPTSVPRVEAALAALARTDRPDFAVPLLLSFAGSDRARVAVYSVGRASRRCIPAAIGAQLCVLAADRGAKITSRKEAIRLLAELLPPGADDTLTALAAQPTTELHHDLRIAIAWAAVRNPGRAWAGPVIDALATGTLDEQRALLALNPTTVPKMLQERVASHVVALSRVPDLALRQRSLSLLPIWSGALGAASNSNSVPSVDRALEAFSDLEELAWSAGAEALARMTFDGLVRPEALATRCAALVALVVAPSDRSRDIPAFQRLDAFVTKLTARPWQFRRTNRDCLSAVVGVLTDPVLVVHRTRLLLAAVDWRDPSAVLQQIATPTVRGADRLFWSLLPDLIASSILEQASTTDLSVSSAPTAPGSLGAADTMAWPPFERWSAIVDEFGANAGVEEGEIGAWIQLGIVQSAGHLSRWTEEWYARLVELRSHSDPAVRRFAYGCAVTAE